MHTLLFSSQGAVIIAVFSVAAWIIGHQSSHCVAIKTGRAQPMPILQNIMGLETFLGFAFLGWFAYQIGIVDALILLGLSLVVRLFIVKAEVAVGLTKQAWIISTLGVAVVPVALGGLVWFIQSQNLN